MSDDESVTRQGLKGAIWYTVAQIVQEEELGLDVTASENFVATLTEMVYSQAETLAGDLEANSKHAGRSTINVEDVKLVSRRNPALHEIISQEATKLTNPNSTSTSNKSKTKAGTSTTNNSAVGGGGTKGDGGATAGSIAVKPRMKPRPSAGARKHQQS